MDFHPFYALNACSGQAFHPVRFLFPIRVYLRSSAVIVTNGQRPLTILPPETTQNEGAE
jgi:hypothetical protein